MRPRYETEADRENAARVINHIAQTLGRRVKPLSNELPVNFALYNNTKMVKVVDVRCRRTAMWQYPTVIMSQRRLDRAYEFAQRNGVDLMIVVRWLDHIGFLKIDDPRRFPRKIGGRTDRMDAADIEALYHVPVGEFKIFPPEKR